MKHLLITLLFWTLALPGFSVIAGDKEAGRKPNRLIKEASPYLRQHAYNPVDWYPWGEEAFAKARKENKPILLSVGYSTCHWCHVMEKESYSDQGIADLLNNHFVPIKVDRERRPDVDETYMIATELLTQRGGWPNNVFLTPDLKPFYAGTYFPKNVFTNVLTTIQKSWESEQAIVKQDAEKIAGAISQVMTRRIAAAEITPKVLEGAANTLLKTVDSFYGGFSDAPKFPQENLLFFHLHIAERDGHKEALTAVRATLNGMLNGGIQDHIGGGFHRYSVDNEWRVPHFEKMLYNQAQIGRALLRAYRLTGEPRYQSAARRTLDFVLNEMTSAEGGFLSAFDADSEGGEGLYYLWTPDELKKVLKQDATFATKVFGVTKEGNFEGRNILHFPESPVDLAYELKLDEADFFSRINRLRKPLWKVRKKRTPPHRDDKIVMAWNGLMIAALAEASEILSEPRYLQAASKAANFLWTKMRNDKGVLFRAFFKGDAALQATQTDYAALALALIALYDATNDGDWLQRAEDVTAVMITRFEDKIAGDFYRTAETETFQRGKSRSDADTPSGNALALELFAKLMRRSRNPEYRRKGEALLAALSGLALQSVNSNAYGLMAADVFLRGETGPRQYLAKGTVRATGMVDKEKNLLRVILDIAPGWHINAHKPLEDFFIPTELIIESGEEKSKITYPKPIRRKLDFHSKELALYEGRVEINAPFKKGAKINLRLQACSNKICLEPETVVMNISLKKG